MRAAIKKGPVGRMRSVDSAKKRGRSIASVAVSFAVPIAAGLRGVSVRTSFPSMPFDPDVDTVFALSQSAAPPVIAVQAEKADCGDQSELGKAVCESVGKSQKQRIGQNLPCRKGMVRAVARHQKSPEVVEKVQTRGMRFAVSRPEFSNLSASYQPVESVQHHVYATRSTRRVTELRQCQGAS